MGVDSCPRVSKHGAKDGLKINQSGGAHTQPAQSPAIDARFVFRFAAPFRGSENGQADRQGKKSLRKSGMNDRQRVLQQDDAQPANNSLEDDQ